jgi:hypothetical protein
MAGQHYAVALYLGSQALHDFLHVHYHQPADSAERLMEIPQLQLSFEDRDFLQDEDRQIIKQLGLRFRGANSWPLFRSYRPGFFPWPIDADEARLLDGALEQTLEVAPRYRRDPSLLYPGGEHWFLVRARAGDAWEDRQVHIPPPPPPLGAPVDALSLARCHKLPRASQALEAALFRLWSPVRDGDSRPFYPYVLLLVDARGGGVVAFEMLAPLPSLEDMWAAVPLQVVRQFLKMECLPGEVRVSAPRLLAALGPLAADLDFALTHAPSLPRLEQVSQGLAQAARAGFPPGLIPVDFGPGGMRP